MIENNITMERYCTTERNVQIVLQLMKAHGIKKVIASPGSTDVVVVESMQNDKWFEMYSCIDERSAAYMACGMAAETQEPVAIVCTGATSSRNYMPGMTEAYYRHLPILALTCSQANSKVGHYINQVTDRSDPPSDTTKVSVYCQAVHTANDEWDVMIKANNAMLEMTRNGGGPAHINIEVSFTNDYSVKNVEPVRVIRRFCLGQEMPEIKSDKIAVFVGNHSPWSDELTLLVDEFCEVYNAVVLCDPTSNYKGKYRVLFPLIADQFEEKTTNAYVDLLIHIGDVSSMILKANEVWRISPDGEIRDTFQKMTKVFQISEMGFFSYYTQGRVSKTNTNIEIYRQKYQNLYDSIPEIPFSNIWIAKKLSKLLPDNSVLHLGIRNSLRSWGYFDIPKSVLSYSNTGGFGIDGGMSSLVGASMVRKDKLYFGVFGDLLFFYDMNCLGNRDIGTNLRIMLVNNGLGQEFKNYSCTTSSILGKDAEPFICAKGHYGQQSKSLVKGYAESLGFEYLVASSKEEFESVYKRFITPHPLDKPILFEVFTDTDDENTALEAVNMISSKSKAMKAASDRLNTPLLKGMKSIVKKIAK